jgi:hypothetical protein
MAQEPKESSARSAIILAGVVTAVALYVAVFGAQTVAVLDAHRMLSANPWLAEVPQPLPTASAPPAASPAPPATKPGAKTAPKSAIAKTTGLKAYNYEWVVPWTGKMTQTPGVIYNEFRFDSGPVVDFFDPDAQADIIRTIRDNTGRAFAAFQPLIANDEISTNYELYKSVYATSPEQISFHTSANDSTRLRILLLTKLSFGFDLQKKATSFDFGEEKGVQFGDPAKNEPVALRVFNGRDKQFRFIFTVRDGSSARITQDDINQTVQSLQPVPLLER